MNFFGRKKAVSINGEKRNDLIPSAYNKYCNKYDKNADKEDDCSNATGDYGVILIKTDQHLKSSSVWDKGKNTYTTNHRGKHSSEQNKPKDAPEGLVERLSFAICGICASDKYVWHEYPSAASTDISEDSFDKAGPNAILIRQNQFLEEENQRLETSLLTDVSFLTDGSPMDLELNDIDNDLSSSFDLGVKALPAFRKTPAPRRSRFADPAPKDLLQQTRNNPMWIRKMNAVEEITGISNSRSKPPPAPRKPRPPSSIRRSQRDPPMPEDLLQQTRKNPMWKSQMSNVMKKSSNKKRKSSSSSRRKKRFPLERPEVRRMV